jgi:hypothetical protein
MRPAGAPVPLIKMGKVISRQGGAGELHEKTP